jgi:hypothetical protein
MVYTDICRILCVTNDIQLKLEFYGCDKLLVWGKSTKWKQENINSALTLKVGRVSLYRERLVEHIL